MKFYTYLPMAAFLAFTPFWANAKDDVEEDLTVILERPDQQVYESDKMLRVSIGGTTGVAYNDNIYRSENAEESDFIGIFRPGFRVKTDLKPYQAEVQGRLEMGEYFTQSENSYIDTDIQGRLGYDITEHVNVYVKARHQLDHVAIGAFNDVPDSQAATPTDYSFVNLAGGVKVDAPAWVAHLHTGVDFYDYDNTERRDGTAIINDDRDRDENRFVARAGYKLQEDAIIYVEGTYNRRQYDERIDSTASFERDSDGFEGVVGLRLGDKRQSRLYADLGVGYLQQDYDASVLPTVDGLALRGKLQWLPDDFWRITGNASREVRETTTGGASGYMQTRLASAATYQLTPEWKLGGKIRFTQNDFEVNPTIGGVERTDRIYDGSVFADYNFYEDYFVGGEYLYITRDSDANDKDYISNIFMLRLGVLY